jgi:orotidine-5'-phosphate decarboxylase
VGKERARGVKDRGGGHSAVSLEQLFEEKLEAGEGDQRLELLRAAAGAGEERLRAGDDGVGQHHGAVARLREIHPPELNEVRPGVRPENQGEHEGEPPHRFHIEPADFITHGSACGYRRLWPTA